MNRVTRLLALAGVGIAAGMTIGAGPASAAPAAGQDATHRTTTQVTTNWDDDDDDYRLVGYFDTGRQCAAVGRIGEFRDRWEDYSCFPVRSRFHRGDWALLVSDDDDNCDWSDYRDDRFYSRPYFGGRGFGNHFGGGIFRF
jgi:hypothetical protein